MSEEQSETIGALVKALSEARAKIGKIGKGKSAEIATKGGSKYSYSYADLADVLEAVAKPLAEHGLVLIQTLRVAPSFQLVTTLAHSSGEWVRSAMPLPAEDGDARSLGSWLTYLRRYSVCALVGVAAEDDDDAEQAKPAKRQQTQTADSDAMKSLRDQVAKAAVELEQYTGKSPEALIEAASSFTAKDGKHVKGFADPHDPSVKSEKWLKSTLAKLLGELAQHEPGAAEGADLFA